jgi:hypothetical protein
MAEFGLQRFALGVQNQNGTPDIQAGSHPYALTNTFVTNFPLEEARVRDVRLELPPGFVGDPNATPRCTYQEFITLVNKLSSCSNETAIGLSTTYVNEPKHEAEEPGNTTPGTDPVYNLVPPAGVAAEFGFIVVGKAPVLLQTSVRSGGDYGLTTIAPNIPDAEVLAASKVTIWGVPASPVHNAYRGTCVNQALGRDHSFEEVGHGLRTGEDELEGPLGPNGRNAGETLIEQAFLGADCATQAPVIPLLTNPTSCGTPRTATESVDDWEEPGVYHSKTVSLPEIAGCESLDFSPTVTVKPDLPDASTSSGLTVDIKVPQGSTEDPKGLGEADVKDTTVMLPPGVAINPSAGNGLEACSSDPGALAGNQLGSAGDGIGYEGVKPSTQAGQSELGFSSALPGSIAATNGVATGSLASSEDLLQPGLNFCANGSKVATVRIKTPLLEHELTGAQYLGAQEANPFGSLLALYIVVEDPVSGALVKLPGEASLCKAAGEVIAGQTCEVLGQIVATFLNDPQLPAEEIEVHYFGGEKAPLTTPSHCGTYTTQTSFVPWSGEPAAHPSAEFQIEHGPNGGPCPGASLPFSPSAHAASLNINAGAFSPFTLTMTRKDGEQNLQSVVATLPPGLSGILSNIELCPEPQANAGECGPNSLIGDTTVSVGVGGDPYTVTGGRDYLTGPYNGSGGCTVGQAGCAPFGLTFEVPAKAGPFDLANTKSNHPACDCIVVRGKIEVNPLTAGLTITSNPPGTPDSIPTSIEGIPLEIQDVNATTTRSNFQFNPTNCSKMEAVGTIESSEKATDTIKVPYQVTNCQALKFTPKFTVSTSGKTSKADGADLVTKVEEPAGSMGTQANLTKVKVELPKQLPSRLTTLQKACTDKQFELNPANCPSESKIGYAVVHTPLVPVPLEGPAIFVSHGGEAFPSLTMVLQGYGVTIDLVGTTFISKSGITSTTFKTVPDQPFSSFQLTLPEGKYSALAANGNLCTQKLTMPTEFIGQNGAELHQSTAVSTTGCSTALSVVSSKVNKKTLTLSVYAPAAGKVTASGKGVSGGVKTYSTHEALTFTLKQKKAGRLKTKIKLTFIPSKGRKQAKTVKEAFRK